MIAVLLQQFAGVVAFVLVAAVLILRVPREPRMVRHRADPDLMRACAVRPTTPGGGQAGPTTGPLYLGALHGVVTDIPPMPPRPFTPAAGIRLSPLEVWRASGRAARGAHVHGEQW